MSTRTRRRIRRSFTGSRCRRSATSCTTSAGTSARRATAMPGDRRYLIVPGLKSGRIHIVDAKDPLNLKMHKVIEPEADREGRGPVGPAHGPLPAERRDHDLDARQREGRRAGWVPAPERQVRADRPLGEGREGDELQLRLLVPAAAQRDGVERMGRAEDLRTGPELRRRESGEVRPARFTSGTGRSGRFARSFDLGAAAIPLEVRFAHDPAKAFGFVGAALSSAMWHVRTDRARMARLGGHEGGRTAAGQERQVPRRRGAGAHQRFRAVDGRPASCTCPRGCTARSASTTSPIRRSRS